MSRHIEEYFSFLPKEITIQSEKEKFETTFLFHFCTNKSVVQVKFTWFQFHRCFHGRHRCTGMDRTSKPYSSSTGGHARKEVDAWFQRTHPQFSHWEKIRKNHIRIHSLENYSPSVKNGRWRKNKRAFKSIGGQQCTGWRSNYSTGDLLDWRRGGRGWISKGFLGMTGSCKLASRAGP